MNHFRRRVQLRRRGLHRSALCKVSELERNHNYVALTINLVPRFDLRNRDHCLVQPQMRMGLLVQFLGFTHEASGKCATCNVKLPVVKSKAVVGPRCWAEERAKQGVSRCQWQHGEKT